jgi:hypothetical protein
MVISITLPRRRWHQKEVLTDRVGALLGTRVAKRGKRLGLGKSLEKLRQPTESERATDKRKR